MKVRLWHRLLKGSAVAAVLLSAQGCVEEPATSFPDSLQTLAFPKTLAASQSGDRLFVVNSNRDRRYSVSWVSVVDVEVLAQVGGDGPISPVLQQLRVPSLASDIGFSADGSTGLLSALGDAPLVALNWDGETLDCGDKNADEGLPKVEARTDCDAEHFVELHQRVLADAPVPLRAEIEEDLSADVFLDPHKVLITEVDGQELATISYVNSVQGTGEVGGYISVVDLETLTHSAVLEIANQALGGVVEVPGFEGRYVASEFSDGDQIYLFDLASGLGDGDAEQQRVLDDDLINGSRILDLFADASSGRIYVLSSGPDALWVIDVGSASVMTQNASGVGASVDTRPSFEVVHMEPLYGTPTSVVRLPDGSLALSLFESRSILTFSTTAGEMGITRRLDNVDGGVTDLVVVSSGGEDYLVAASFEANGLDVFRLANDPADHIFVGHYDGDAP